ncbi:DoxX family protein [uncultured Erythrobacter sp.]|uniref:DoxX family protein n=1 Tax=uncultured Erythrobacter sp. TaxID=263913 RepID=UPI00265807D4|nr:DoxX family protein [uncultured Erythrobacter sp.]
MERIAPLSLRHALMMLRIVTALLFMAHAAVRIVHGTIPQFGAFMESVGFPEGEVLVWAITLAELVAGAAMIANRYVTQAAATLIMIAATGILLIHRHFGWFVGEHGTGGSEYSVALMAALIVIIAADRDANASMSGTRQT